MAVAAALAVAAPRAPRAAAELSLTDQEFRTLITSMSERGGSFVTDNIVSNEIAQQDVLPDVERTHRGALHRRRPRAEPRHTYPHSSRRSPSSSICSAATCCCT